MDGRSSIPRPSAPWCSMASAAMSIRRGERWGFLDWDFPGLRHAVHVDGSLNKRDDTDRGWTAELAFPWQGLQLARRRPLSSAARTAMSGASTARASRRSGATARISTLAPAGPGIVTGTTIPTSPKSSPTSRSPRARHARKEFQPMHKTGGIRVLSLILLALVFPAQRCAAAAERRISFNDNWRFLKGDATGRRTSLLRRCAVGAPLELPHDWAIEGPFDVKTNPTHRRPAHLRQLPGTAIISRFRISRRQVLQPRVRRRHVELDASGSTATKSADGPTATAALNST